MSLKNEDIVRIMTNDLNKEVLLEGTLNVVLCGFQYNGYPKPVIRNIKTWDTRMVNDLSIIKLYRTPLHKMTEDKILGLCKAASETAFVGYQRYEKWQVIPQYSTDGTNWDYVEVKNKRSEFVFGISLITGDVRIFNVNGEYEPSLLNHTYWQWYQQERIAIPLYPWNKNAFELNLAVEF